MVENNTTVTTYQHGNATVRIHAGKMTAEERQAAFTEASRKLRNEMMRRKVQKREPA